MMISLIDFFGFIEDRGDFGVMIVFGDVNCLGTLITLIMMICLILFFWIYRGSGRFWCNDRLRRCKLSWNTDYADYADLFDFIFLDFINKGDICKRCVYLPYL